MSKGYDERREFTEGDMGEGFPWAIETNSRVSYHSNAKTPCRHCFDDHVETYGGTYKVREWTCPRVVVAVNEGGHNVTALCLDCVLDAAKEVS